MRDARAYIEKLMVKWFKLFVFSRLSGAAGSPGLVAYTKLHVPADNFLRPIVFKVKVSV
jgi:hypothetical protein